MHDGNAVRGLLIAGIGAFSIAGAVLEWEFFMNHRKARFIQAIFGRTGARVFYVLLGVVMLGLGIAFSVA